MVKILKSEFLKLKNSAILYLMIGLFALEWLTIPVYLSNHQTSYALEAMTFLPMLAYCYSALSYFMGEHWICDQ